MPFVYSWHIGLFCEHLEAVSTGQLPEPNLLVNTPPGTSKSLIFSVLWPAWEWTWAPWTRWLTSSYDDALALRDAVKTRTLMQSEWYQRQVTEPWSFTSYQNVKGYYLNNRTGWRIATSMGGGNTGWHAHRVMCLAYNVPVLTDQGEMPIGRVVEQRLPVRVRSFDHMTGRSRWSRIEAYERNPGRESVRVRLSNGRTIEGTTDHPVYVEGQGYTPLESVLPGQAVVTDRATVRYLWSRSAARASAYGPAQGSGVLLEDVFPEVVGSTGQSSARPRRVVFDLPDLWCAIRASATQDARAESVLFESLSGRRVSSESATSSSEVCCSVLRVRQGIRGVRTPAWAADLLFTNLCESGASVTNARQGQRQLSDWPVSHSIHAGVHRVVSQASESARRLGVCRVRSRAEVPSSSSHRRWQDQSSPDESRDALHSVSSERSFADRVGRNVDGTVRVVAVERIPTPDAVYNVRVADDHNYFAAGILVHNCDDAHNVLKAESDAEREEVLKTWREVYPSRVLPGGVRVVVGQRTHEEDLTADWLKREGQDIHHLELQMEHERPAAVPVGTAAASPQAEGGHSPFESSRGVCSLTQTLHDRRTREGELLIPDRFPKAVIEKRKIELGSYAWSAQYQQRPSPRAGAIFHPAWFPDLPEGLDWSKLDRVQAWDLAFSELQSADRTAAVSLGVEQTSDPHMYASDFFRERIDEGRLDEVMADHIMATHSRYVFVEEGIFKKAAAVRDLIRRVEMLLSMRNYLCTIDTIPADADKVSRARLIEGRCKAGYIAVNRRHPTWPAMQTELTTFPKGGSDDLVDALVHGVRAAIEKLATVRAQRELLGQSSRLQYVSAQPIAKPWPASWNGLLDGAR